MIKPQLSQWVRDLIAEMERIEVAQGRPNMIMEAIRRGGASGLSDTVRDKAGSIGKNFAALFEELGTQMKGPE